MKKPDTILTPLKETKKNLSKLSFLEKLSLVVKYVCIYVHIFQVALMEYTTGYEGICRMAESEEYLKVYQHKVLGLRDTHTYWSQQIF